MENKKILIKKVKILNDNTAEIKYTTADDLGKGDITFTGDQEVTGEFKEAFQNCVNSFVACVPELEKSKKNIKMNAIKFDYGKDSDKLQNALYSVKFNFNPANNAVINISTPNLPIYQEHFDEHTFCIAGEHEQMLYEIQNLAKKYLRGQTKTEQLKTVKEDKDGNVVINFANKE
jgi:hypothetical protein